MSELSKASVEAYLQSNPEFARGWFLRNIDEDQLLEWKNQSATKMVKSGSSSLPVRKSSVRETDRNSMTAAMFEDFVAGKRKLQPGNRRTKQELLSMNEIELFMELIRDIANELDVDVLCHKILLNVSILTKSDRGSLFLVRGQSNKRYLVSKLFDVTENSSLEDSLHNEDQQIRVPFGRGIAGVVAESKEPINIKDAYEDPRFNKDVDKRTGYRTRSILCMPILNFEGEVVGIAQIMNKNGETKVFTREDEEVFRNYLTFCGIGLTNAQLFEMSVQEYKRNQMLLGLARGIFEEQTNLDSLVQKIMLEAQELLRCERCSVYLLDNSETTEAIMEKLSGDAPTGSPASKSGRRTSIKKTKAASGTDKDIHFIKVFELHGENTAIMVHPTPDDIKQSKSASIAREVVTSGMVKNVAEGFDGEIMEHEDLSVRDYDGFRIRCLLGLPIKDTTDKVIGVVLLMNKINGKPFTATDANICEAFAIFCGLGVHNCQMYESACKLMAKQKVALEVLSYHAMASPEDVEKLATAVVKTATEYDLTSFGFSDFPLDDDDTLRATLRMFLDMGVTSNFHVPYDVLCRWTLSVKKNYRPVTYHNWRHAFNVAQTMFSMLYTGNMAHHMDNIDMFALIVACLCHDLDHRGTNNAFQSKSSSPLATLYGTSTMEHHHFDQCIMILNSEGNNIFEHFSEDDYRKVITTVEAAILSTDLALYFKKKAGFEKLVTTGETKWNEPHKKDLLRGMMMTACDVAAITKPWEIQYEIAHLVAGEFFEQGDLERDKLNEQPMAMMDRSKKDDLPKMQVGFIDAICLPVYKMFAMITPGLEPLLSGVVTNKNQWQRLADLVEQPKNVEPPPPTKETKIAEAPPQPKVQPVVAANGHHIPSKANTVKPVAHTPEKDTMRRASTTCHIL